MVQKFKYRLFTLHNCLFGSVNLTKNNADPHKYKYCGFGIGFDSLSEFSFTDGSMGKKLFFLESIGSHLCILITEIEIS